MRNATAIVTAIGLILALGAPVRADFAWDFWDGAGNDNGWTVENGFTNFRGGDGGGVDPAPDGGGGHAQDHFHPIFLIQSPLFAFTGGTLDGTNVLSVQFGGGAGDQNGFGQILNNPADVLAYNGGTINNAGQKGLAFLNAVTGVYDATIFKAGNGGNPTMDFTAADLSAAGVDLSGKYVLNFYDTDEGGWGWTQLNFVNVAADATVLIALDRELLWDGHVGKWGDLTDPIEHEGMSHWLGGATGTEIPEITGPTADKATIDDGAVTVASNQGALELEMRAGVLAVNPGQTLTILRATTLDMPAEVTIHGTLDTNTISGEGLVTMEAGGRLKAKSGSLFDVVTTGDATVEVAGALTVVNYDDSGIDGTLVKEGPGLLDVTTPSIVATSPVIQVTAGQLKMHMDPVNPLGAATLNLDGGEFIIEGPVTQSLDNGLAGSLFRNTTDNDAFLNLDGSTYANAPGRIFTGDKGGPVLQDGREEPGYNIIFTGSTECADNNDWGPFPTLDSDWEHFVTAYSGRFFPAETGTYRFRFDSDDRAWMWIDMGDDGTFASA